jgi:hypothetical protein
MISTRAATISALFKAQELEVEISPTRTHHPTRYDRNRRYFSGATTYRTTISLSLPISARKAVLYLSIELLPACRRPKGAVFSQ